MQKNLLLFSIIILIFSCKKKPQDITPDTIIKVTNGSSKVWALADITTNGKSIIETCAKDDEYEFIKATSTINYEPKTKCYSNDDAKTLEYQVSNDSKSITIDNYTYLIEILTDTKMVLSHDGDGGAKINSAKSTLHNQQTLTFITKIN